MPRLSRVLRHGQHGGKEPVIIVVAGESYVLQVPCTNCHGGEFLAYHPATRNRVGMCPHCTDGLVDTPLYAAIKKHLRIFPELPGTWRAKPVFEHGLLLALPGIKGVEGTLHFYPDDWSPRSRYERGLCCQGLRRDNASVGDPALGGVTVCQNCLRIKTFKEHGKPVIYG